MTAVIRVERLSKKYILGHDRRRGARSLRETLTETGRRLLGRLRGPRAAHSPDPGPGDFWALRDVSLEIAAGERVGIIGRNGAGKSTLLKILSRITEPTEGRIRIRGHVASLLEVGTGFHPELTGRENIYLNGAILGMGKAEIRRKFDEIVDFSEVEQFLDTPVKHYSSGMHVRLAFAVAAHLDPEILIVDEVLAVGDLSFRKKCMGKMKDISASSSRTVLFVSHDLSAVQAMCTRGVLLEQGRVQFDGGAGDAVQRYLSRAAGDGGRLTLSWSAPPRKEFPFSDVIRVNGYAVVDADGKVPDGPLYGSKRYRVVIDADLKRADPRLILAVAYYTADRTLLFISDIHDSGDGLVERLETGTIRLAVPLAQDLLLNREYEIELLCCLHCTGWVLPPENESSIRIQYFRDNEKNPYAQENRLGLLGPELRWCQV